MRWPQKSQGQSSPQQALKESLVRKSSVLVFVLIPFFGPMLCCKTESKDAEYGKVKSTINTQSS